MKSRQRHNSKNSNFIKQQQQHPDSNSSQSQQQHISQWDIHTNRLNYIQQTITKLQKKINKLQKALSSAHGEFRDQISEKIAQMIEIITNQQQQPKQQKQQKKREKSHKFSEEIAILRQEIKNISVEMSDVLEEKLSGIDERIAKIQASSNNLNKREVKNLIEQRVSQVQAKISQQIDSSIIQIYQKMDQYQANLKDINTKIERKEDQYDSKFKFTNNTSSKQKVYQIDRMQTSPQSSTRNLKGGNYTISKRQNEKQNTTNIFQRKSHDVIVSTGTSNMMHKTKNAQPTFVPESETKCNRVVYLRQKLKEFQNINRKYDIKDKSIDTNNITKRSLNATNQFSTTKLKSVSKDPSQASRQFTQSQMNSSHDPTSNRPSYISTLQKPYNKPQSSESSSKKHSITRINNLSNNLSACLSSSSSKKSMRNQIPMTTQNKQSAKKMEKLKSIRDYLEQAQSEIDQSVLEPNYA